MKLFNQILLSALGTISLFSSCSYYERFDDPKIDLMKGYTPANTTISALKDSMYAKKLPLITDNASSNSYKNVFSIYQLPADSNYVINAVVVSDDIDGNSFKKIVLRDLKDSSAIDISIDATAISAFYPKGQKVTVKPAQLHIGLYADCPAIGFLTHNSSKNRDEVGRMPEVVALNKITNYGLPDLSLAQPEVKTIETILNSGNKVYGRLVQIKNVTFGYYHKNGKPEIFPDAFGTPNEVKDVNDEDALKDVIFSFKNPQTNNSPISRAIIDEKGNVITISTSAFAKFADKTLPLGRYNVTAIVGWYKDKADRKGGYQLAIQNFEKDIIKVSK